MHGGQRERDEGHAGTEVGLGQAQESQAEVTRNREGQETHPALQALEGPEFCWISDYEPQTGEGIHFYRSKPPSLWKSVAAAPGHDQGRLPGGGGG